MAARLRVGEVSLQPMDCSLLGSTVLGILQARIPKWIAMPPPGDLPDPGIEPISLASPALQADSLPTEPPGKPCIEYAILKYK